MGSILCLAARLMRLCFVYALFPTRLNLYPHRLVQIRGGRYWDRTSDPFDVNEVLYR